MLYEVITHPEDKRSLRETAQVRCEVPLLHRYGFSQTHVNERRGRNYVRVGILRARKYRNGDWGDIGALAFTSVVPSATTASVVRKLIRGRRRNNFV